MAGPSPACAGFSSAASAACEPSATGVGGASAACSDGAAISGSDGADNNACASSATRSRRCASSSRCATAARSPPAGGAARTAWTSAEAASSAARNATLGSCTKRAACSSWVAQCTFRSSSNFPPDKCSAVSPSPVVKHACASARTKPAGSSVGFGSAAFARPASNAVARSSREAPYGGRRVLRPACATCGSSDATHDAAILSSGRTDSRLSDGAAALKRGASQTSDHTDASAHAVGGMGTPLARALEDELPMARWRPAGNWRIDTGSTGRPARGKALGTK
mmetsp:Transcript_28931/g.87516  ORF Transcript_28931/g.87516 Transcript_28931/m.87516 type:complete len:281 (+) Transcript_28931:1034-1876(+)